MWHRSLYPTDPGIVQADISYKLVDQSNHYNCPEDTRPPLSFHHCRNICRLNNLHTLSCQMFYYIFHSYRKCNSRKNSHPPKRRIYLLGMHDTLLDHDYLDIDLVGTRCRIIDL